MGWLVDLVRGLCCGFKKWMNLPDTINGVQKELAKLNMLIFGLDKKQDTQGERISRLEGIVINGNKYEFAAQSRERHSEGREIAAEEREARQEEREKRQEERN